MNSSTDPRLEPRYEAARTAGLLPAVPEHPPAPVVPNSSKRIMWSVAAAIISIGATTQATNHPGLLGVLIVISACVFVYFFTSVSALKFAEYDAGYCRTRHHVGMLPGQIGPQNNAGPAGREWDASGLWLLGFNDEVIEPPDRDVLPPGWYPRGDQWDVWTGKEWLNRPRPSRPDSFLG